MNSDSWDASASRFGRPTSPPFLSSSAGASLIGIGVLMSAYARTNNGPLLVNQAGVVLFVVGLIVYFAGRASHYKNRMRVPKDPDAE